MNAIKTLKHAALLAGLLAVASTSFAQSSTNDAAMQATSPSPGAGNLPVKGTDADNMNTPSTDRAMTKKKTKKAKKMSNSSANSGANGMSGSASTSGTSGTTGATASPSTRSDVDMNTNSSGGSGKNAPGTVGAMSGASVGADVGSQPSANPNNTHATPMPGSQNSDQSKGH